MATEEDLEEMDEESQGIVAMMMNARRTRKAMTCVSDAGVAGIGYQEHGYEPYVIDMTTPLHVVNSWELDFLSVSVDERQKVVMTIIFDTQLGHPNREHVSPNIFQTFFDKAMEGYSDQPYHNATHACDVFHTVYRLMCETHALLWVSPVETYGLMVAGICHDLGHQGKTNQYLVETQHEWALNYNDKSPLENMHCARLFRISAIPENNCFEKLNKTNYARIRKVIIAAILHTDNVNHFQMVKELLTIGELSQKFCQDQAENLAMENAGTQDGKPWDPIIVEYDQEVLQQNTLLFLELFLHMSDVGNPLKQFEMCKAWGLRVLQEFFAQGDEEKKLGLPVGMLNDRDKINIPGAQVGFIEHLVSPFVFATVDIFPGLHKLSSQMASNIAQWCAIWKEDAKPDKDAMTTRDTAIKKVEKRANELVERTQIRDTNDGSGKPTLQRAASKGFRSASKEKRGTSKE
jgi:hypothetical protein